jgi:acetyl-CoA carboxylase carboxyl transferase subunit beta
MNWISKTRTPGLKTILSKKDTPDDLWIKCPVSGELVYRTDIEDNWFVTPAGAHLRISPRQRFRLMFDDERWEPIALPEVAADPLKFKDDKPYPSRIKSARAKIAERDKKENEEAGGLPVLQDDCMAAAYGKIGGQPAVVLVQDFDFMGGSLGMAAGEAFITAAEMALARQSAFIVFTASGGARMQEGTLSLMQMPRTTLAINDLNEARLPYLVVLTDPTSGGVSASYAMLGDVHLAEPGAMIAFSGPRVIEQTIRESLPKGFQRAEFLREKGQVDIVVDRRKMKAAVTRLLTHMMPKNRRALETYPVSLNAPKTHAPPKPDPRGSAA